MPTSALLTPRALTDTVNQVIVPSTFVLDTVFKKRKLHTAVIVDIPVRKHRRKLARFNNRGDAANVVDKGDKELKTVKLPHISEKKASKAATSLFQLANGQSVGLGADPMESLKLELAEDLAELKERGIRTTEWMACQALTGLITVSQPNLSFTFDFGFHSSHKPVLTGTGRWGEADADIVGDIRAWKRKILKDSGFPATTGILGPDAADAFVQDEKILKMLNNNNTKVGSIDLNSDSNYIGRVLGIDWWEYEQSYVDESNNEAEMWNPAAVSITASAAPFVRNYGPMSDLKAQLKPAEFFAKSWEEEDPSTVWTKVETNPLPAVHDPNAAIYAIVR